MLPTGQGQSPDLLMAAGEEGTPLPPRPVRARANDASRVEGIVACGDNTGTVDTERTIPWL